MEYVVTLDVHGVKVPEEDAVDIFAPTCWHRKAATWSAADQAMNTGRSRWTLMRRVSILLLPRRWHMSQPPHPQRTYHCPTSTRSRF